MRWDRGYQSPNVDDRRSERGGGSTLPLGALLAAGSRFGWKGILVALLLVGAMTLGGGRLCSGGSSAPTNTVEKAPTDDLAGFVGFVLDDVQKTWRALIPNYETTRLELFRNAINSACGTATAAVG